MGITVTLSVYGETVDSLDSQLKELGAALVQGGFHSGPDVNAGDGGSTPDPTPAPAPAPAPAAPVETAATDQPAPVQSPDPQTPAAPVTGPGGLPWSGGSAGDSGAASS